LLHYGAPIESARRVAIFIHGRGASAEDILGIAPELGTDDVAYLAPQAAGNTWYPNSFLSPISQNEPGLTSALAVIGALVKKLATDGYAPERIIILGFSQGACLGLEFAARNAQRFAAIVALSG